MFPFTKKSGIFYKPNIENIMSSYFCTKPKPKSPILSKENNYNNTYWTRIQLDITNDYEFDFSNSPRQHTLVSSVQLQKEKKEKSITGVLKNIYYLGYFWNKWVWKQIFGSGFMNWFHPWIVIRHRYFYRGCGGFWV